MNPSQDVWGEEEEEQDTALLEPSLVTVPLRGGEGKDLALGGLVEIGLCCLIDQTSSLAKIQLPRRCCTALATSVCTTRVGTRLTADTKSLP